MATMVYPFLALDFKVTLPTVPMRSQDLSWKVCHGMAAESLADELAKARILNGMSKAKWMEVLGALRVAALIMGPKAKETVYCHKCHGIAGVVEHPPEITSEFPTMGNPLSPTCVMTKVSNYPLEESKTMSWEKAELATLCFEKMDCVWSCASSWRRCASCGHISCAEMRAKLLGTPKPLRLISGTVNVAADIAKEATDQGVAVFGGSQLGEDGSHLAMALTSHSVRDNAKRERKVLVEMFREKRRRLRFKGPHVYAVFGQSERA